MTLDPAQRLGVADNGFDTLKVWRHRCAATAALTLTLTSTAARAAQAHPFFKGLDWTKLYAGQVHPPIQPTKGEIAADLPSTLKDEFKEWARKPIPENAESVFAEWKGLARSGELDIVEGRWRYASVMGCPRSPAMCRLCATYVPPDVTNAWAARRRGGSRRGALHTCSDEP